MQKPEIVFVTVEGEPTLLHSTEEVKVENPFDECTLPYHNSEFPKKFPVISNGKVSNIKHENVKDELSNSFVSCTNNISSSDYDRPILFTNKKMETDLKVYRKVEETSFISDACKLQAFKPVSTKHKRIRSKKQFECYLCGFVCTRKDVLKVHIRHHTGDKPYSCAFCEFKTFRSDNLKSHIRTHTGDKPFVCDLCDFKALRRDSLRVHMRYHTGDKPFACNFCEFKTTRKDNLKVHLRFHNGNQMHACNLCDFKTYQKTNLTSHKRRIHTGEKPHACNLCDFKTIRKDRLIEHLRNHTGEKPYECHLCNYKATSSSYLYKHLRKVHLGNKPYMCTLCGFKSPDENYFMKHLKMHVTVRYIECTSNKNLGVASTTEHNMECNETVKLEKPKIVKQEEMHIKEEVQIVNDKNDNDKILSD